MMNDKLAPVVMVGYSRAWTLRRSLKNLSDCYGLGDRDIYFFLDAPFRDADRKKVEDMHQVAVEAQRTILPRLTVVRRERNLGVPGNLLAAIREVMDRYGRIIFFEDDVLVSKTFIQCMDGGLETYKEDKRIFCINGYKGPRMVVPRSYPHDVFLMPRNSAWGFATWKDRWDKVDFSMKDWPSLRADRQFVKKLHAAGCELFRMAEGVHAGRIRTWDLQCTVHLVRYGLYAIAFRHNLTRNIGFGSEGINCRVSFKSEEKYYNFSPRFERNVRVDPRLAKLICYQGGEDRFLMKVINRLKRPFRRKITENRFEEPQEVSPVR